jgi:hypothetical protein
MGVPPPAIVTVDIDRGYGDRASLRNFASNSAITRLIAREGFSAFIRQNILHELHLSSSIDLIFKEQGKLKPHMRVNGLYSLL